MTRLQKTARNGSVVVAIYLLLLLDVLPVPFVGSSTKESILPVVRCSVSRYWLTRSQR